MSSQQGIHVHPSYEHYGVRVDLVFNRIQLLMTSTGGETFVSHGSVNLIEVRDHLPQRHAAVMECTLSNDALHVAGERP